MQTKTFFLVASAIALVLLLGLISIISKLLSPNKKQFGIGSNSLDEMATGTEYDLLNQKIYDSLYSDEEYTENLCVNRYGKLEKDFVRHDIS
jgi:hypothetical protein